MTIGRLQVDTLEALSGSTITVPVNNAIVASSNGSLVAPGTLLQSQFARSGPTRQTISSATPVAVTGLSITIAPLYANSLILVSAQIQSNYTYVCSFAVFKDGVSMVSTSGQTNSNEANMNFTTYLGTNRTNEFWSMPLRFSETAGSTDARTYQIYATSAWQGTPTTLYINNRDSSDMAAFSYMTVMEIAQ